MPCSSSPPTTQGSWWPASVAHPSSWASAPRLPRRLRRQVGGWGVWLGNLEVTVGVLGQLCAFAAIYVRVLCSIATCLSPVSAEANRAGCSRLPRAGLG